MENNSISSPLKWAGGKRKFSPIIIEAIKDFKLNSIITNLFWWWKYIFPYILLI